MPPNPNHQRISQTFDRLSIVIGHLRIASREMSPEDAEVTRRFCASLERRLEKLRRRVASYELAEDVESNHGDRTQAEA